LLSAAGSGLASESVWAWRFFIIPVMYAARFLIVLLSASLAYCASMLQMSIHGQGQLLSSTTQYRPQSSVFHVARLTTETTLDKARARETIDGLDTHLVQRRLEYICGHRRQIPRELFVHIIPRQYGAVGGDVPAAATLRQQNAASSAALTIRIPDAKPNPSKTNRV
jgi:hypothetical protein